MDNQKSGGFILLNDREGMSKMEMFTMAAMQGLCYMAGTDVLIHGGLTHQQLDSLSICAVAIARATLAELSKHK